MWNLHAHNISPAIHPASTGIAATHIAGTTIHLGLVWYQRPLSKPFTHIATQQVPKELAGKILIIDEISMCFQYFAMVAGFVDDQENPKPFRSISMVLVGDFFHYTGCEA